MQQGQLGTPGAAEREAAQLRYELARLRDRRTVRAALAIGQLRRSGPRVALAAVRGRAPRLDVPGPATVPLRPPLPHLRVLHTGDGYLLRSTCAHERITPDSAEVVLRRDRPDMVVVDGVAGWSPPALTRLHRAARSSGAPLVTIGPSAAAAVPEADLRVATDLPVAGAGLELGPCVDVRSWSPAGLREGGGLVDGTPQVLRALGPAEARTQPVIVVRDVDATGVRRCLELMAAGALLVTGPHDGLRSALAPLDAEVVGPADLLEARAEALLADDDLRRRTSVRLRHHIHARLSTRVALIALVEALHLDDRPSERISVLLATRRPERLGQVLADLAAQRHADLEVIVLPHGDAPLPTGFSEVLPGELRVERVAAERPLGAVLNVGLDLATGCYVAKVDDDDRYGSEHLADQLLALHHSGADLVGKRVHAVYDEAADATFVPPPGGEERHEDHLPGATLLLPADLLRSVRWRHVPRAVDTELIRAIHLAGGSAYSTHRYGFVRVRHGDHLYQPDQAWQGTRTPGFDTRLLEA